MLEWARRVLVSHIAVREITAAELNSTKRRGRRRTVVTVAASVCSSQTCPSVCVCGSCECCRVCARQQGDLCDQRYVCDDRRQLYCQFSVDAGHRGICRGRQLALSATEGALMHTHRPTCSTQLTMTFSIASKLTLTTSSNLTFLTRLTFRISSVIAHTTLL